VFHFQVFFLAQRSGSVTVCAVVPPPCRLVLLGDSGLLLEMGDRELRRCHWAANRGHLIFDTLFFLTEKTVGEIPTVPKFYKFRGRKGVLQRG
jgi:hypothetical protein